VTKCELDYRHAAVWCPSCDALERQTYSTARMQGAIESLALEMRALREDLPTSISAPPRPSPPPITTHIQPPKIVEPGRTYRWKT
jgi:hypothetical protein